MTAARPELGRRHLCLQGDGLGYGNNMIFPFEAEVGNN